MARSVILVHGYGVRGSFWDKLRPRLQCDLRRALAPDFVGDSPRQLADQVESLARTECVSGPVALVGHSLGGVLCALVASRVDTTVVSHVTAIAAPFGGKAKSVNPIVRFLIRYRLLPQFLVRPRFFSRATARRDQKLWFRRAVPESAALQAVLFGSDWFPRGAFATPLAQQAQVIYSEADRIVEAGDTRRLARALGAREYVFQRERAIGHNDFAASDRVADETAAAILDFFRATEEEQHDDSVYHRSP